MAFRLRKGFTIQKNVRRIAGEQIDKAIGEIQDEGVSRHEVVHQVRKRMKKLRGLIRLVRPVFSGYSAENKFFRNRARELSYVRDAQSIVECIDGLVERFESDVDKEVFVAVREEALRRRQIVADDTAGLEAKLEQVLSDLQDARLRCQCWELSDGGFSALRQGLIKTYSRGRDAMINAHKDPTAENFHDWRKRVKYHSFHAQLLRGTWDDMLSVHVQASSDVADLLGSEHDLAVFRNYLLEEADRFESRTNFGDVFDLIERRRTELQNEAFSIGKRLFAEEPKHLAKRFGRYWRLWKSGE